MGDWVDKLEDARQSGDEINAYCPVCGSRKKKFYVNIDTKKFHCFSCETSGGAGKLSVILGETIEGGEGVVSKKVEFNGDLSAYRKVTEQDSIAEYLKGRGIGVGSIDKAGFMTNAGGDTLVMPSRDEAGNVVGIKYRTEDKKIYMKRDSQQILLGIDMVSAKENKRMYCVEGEVDMLTLIELGFDNVVSLPNGTANMNWIDKNWDRLHDFEEIILCMDNDEAGHKALEHLKNALDFTGLGVLDIGMWNDVNECHMNEPDILLEAAENPVLLGIDGFVSLENISTVAGVEDELLSTGLPGLDRVSGGVGVSQSTIVVASSGSGKSTLVSNMVKGMLTNGEKVAIWSGELSNKQLKVWLYTTLGGEEAIITKQHPFRPHDKITSMKPEYEQRINKEVRGRLFTYDGNQNNGFKMLKHFTMLHKRHGVKYFFLDNLSILDMSVKGKGKYEGEEAFSQEVARFTRNNDVHLFMVSHPTKVSINSDPNFLDKSGKVKPIERYTQQQVRGSASLVNLAHNVMFLVRIGDHERAFFEQQARNFREKKGEMKAFEKDRKLIQDDLSVFCYLVKNRSGGFIYEDALFGYDHPTRRLFGLRTKEEDLAREFLKEEGDTDSEFVILSDDEEI